MTKISFRKKRNNLLRLLSLGSSALVFFATLSFAQTFERLSFPVQIDGEALAFPFAGGLNNPQLSEVDLNNDGTQDLLIFDRVGEVVLPFLNEGIANTVSYRFAPEYMAAFPKLNDWVALRDYDGDGVQDIFAAPSIPVSGVEVYKGFYENGAIAFEQIQFATAAFDFNIIPIQTNSGVTQLYVSEADYPAIDDIDNDGDLDIVTFNIGGGYMDYYQNRSVEQGYGRDSLIFIRRDNCWGGLYESGITVAVDLADTLGQCFEFFEEKPVVSGRHAGSTLLTFDADDDGDKDLILGDLSFDNFNFLTNGGTPQEAWMSEQDNAYPSYDVSVDIEIFPAAFYLDINNDGQKDLFAAPNDRNTAQNYEVLWWYENSSTNAIPDFNFVQRDLFVSDMLDFGSGAMPAFVDYNADGLLDIVVGNTELISNSLDRKSALYLLENVGTETAPAFDLVDDDYLNFSQYNPQFFNFAPAFGDLDGDGDTDMLVGENGGTLFYLENTAGLGKPLDFAGVVSNFQAIDPGQVTTPQIVDVNGDGLADLLVGERNGNVNYYENQGTIGDPVFESDAATAPNQDFFGSIDARLPGFFSGYSAPVLLPTDAGMELFTGSEAGIVKQDDLLEEELTSSFPLVNENFGTLQEGSRIRPAFADLNGDGIYDMLVGNRRGGLSVFSTNVQLPVTVATNNLANQIAMQVFPNPVTSHLHIQMEQPLSGTAQLYAMTGQLLLSQKVNGRSSRLHVNDLPAGIYILQIEAAGQRWTQKVVKK